MMDIVEQLRSPIKHPHQLSTRMHEAADEIERLVSLAKYWEGEASRYAKNAEFWIDNAPDQDALEIVLDAAGDAALAYYDAPAERVVAAIAKLRKGKTE